MAENWNRIAVRLAGVGLRGRIKNRCGARNGPAFAIAHELSLRVGHRHGFGHRHIAAVNLDRDL